MNYKNILKTQENLIKALEIHDPRSENGFLNNISKFKIGESLGFLYIEQEYVNPTHRCRYNIRNSINLSQNRNMNNIYNFKYKSTAQFKLPLPNNESYWSYDKDNDWYEYKFIYHLDNDYKNKFIHFSSFTDYFVKHEYIVRIESAVIYNGTLLELTIIAKRPFSSVSEEKINIYMNIYDIIYFSPTNRDIINEKNNKEFSEWICSDELEIIKRSGTMSTCSIEHWLDKSTY